MNEEYLKMVLALPDEFFEGWEWKEGDRFILINRKKGKIVDYQDGTIGDSVLENGEVGYIWTSGYSGEYGFEKYYSEIKPIPNQEQLQKKCIDFENVGKRYTHSNDFSISKRFIALVIEGDLVKNIEEKTLNEMWLEFVEYLVFGKKWDGESWI